MRLLHVSDWHLGATLGRVNRSADHERVLDEIVEIASDGKPDLVLHTGDLFDRNRPAVEDLSRGVDALRRLAGVAPVVVLAGNHDSAHLFDVFDRLLALGSLGSQSNVRFVGRARPPRAGGILTYPTAAGEQIRLASVPFIHPNAVLDAFGIGAEKWTAHYSDKVQLVEESLAAGLTDGFDGTRDLLLFAAHLHVGGAQWSGSERQVHVSDTYATKVEHLPPVTYAAFGHIHRPQQLPGSAALGRYAGSPIPIDFGEEKEEKSVVMVTATPGRATAIEQIPLSGGRELRRLEGTLRQLSTRSDINDAILKLIIDVEEPTPDLAAQVQELFPAASIFDIVERCASVETTEIVTEADAEGEPDVRLLFREFVGEQGVPAARVDSVLATFSSLLDAMSAEQPLDFDEEALFEEAQA